MRGAYPVVAAKTVVTTAADDSRKRIRFIGRRTPQQPGERDGHRRPLQSSCHRRECVGLQRCVTAQREERHVGDIFGREPVDKPFVLTLSLGEASVAIRADGIGHFVVQ